MENITPERALLTTRVFWGVMLGGQIVFAMAITRHWPADAPPALPSEAARVAFYVALGLLLILLPLGFHLRGHLYKKYWRGPAIAPEGYLCGNLVLLALCEVVSLAGLIVVVINRAFWPAILPSLVAAAVQAINFPNGQAMEPAEPR